MTVRYFPISGEVDLAAVIQLQRKLDVLIIATDDDIVLDCTDVTFIDCAGIRLFEYVFQALESLGRECTIENLNYRMRRPFEILGLADRFGLRESISEES